MRVLVTGREGQLARSLAVRAANYPELDVVFVARPQMDLSIPGSFANAIEELRPDLVINAAAYTAVDDAEGQADLAFQINGEAAGEGAIAAAKVGAVFIQLSTDYVFDGQASAPVPEDHPVAPLGVYGRSKLAGEEKVRAAGGDHIIVRTSWVVSPFGRNFLRTMLAAASDRDELRVVADQRGSPTNALDLADAVLVLTRDLSKGAKRLSGRTFHVTNAGEASWFELAEAIMEEAARNGLPNARIRAIATADWPTPARRPAYSVLDGKAFAQATGHVMPHWREAAGRLVADIARAG